MSQRKEGFSLISIVEQVFLPVVIFLLIPTVLELQSQERKEEVHVSFSSTFPDLLRVILSLTVIFVSCLSWSLILSSSEISCFSSIFPCSCPDCAIRIKWSSTTLPFSGFTIEIRDTKIIKKTQSKRKNNQEKSLQL